MQAGAGVLGARLVSPCRAPTLGLGTRAIRNTGFAARFSEMQKTIAILLASVLLFGVLGCGGSTKPDPKAAAAAKVVNPPDPPETTFKNKRR